MRRGLRMMLGTVGIAATFALSGGCALGLDVFSDDFFPSLGIDVSGLRAPVGRSIVNFRNETEFPVRFNYILGVNPDNLAAGVDAYDVLVNAGEARNQVFDCSINFVDLGTVDEAFEFTPLAAQIINGDGDAQVAYAGARLVNGEEFFCGNVIDVSVQLENVNADGAVGFQPVIRVRIIRGR